MNAAGYVMHKPDMLIVLAVYCLAILCGYKCGRYDERFRRRGSAPLPEDTE